jgi:peptidoglycan/xylan/chitin deacetylase (PgdA/CDA1 family)
MAKFEWPNGKKGALSLTFDDARSSQLDVGIPILDRFGAPGTFYISPPAVEARLDAWKAIVARGHEIGNHTLSHPCSETFLWSRENALEDYTLEIIEAEMDMATAYIEAKLGVSPATFAYPCGQKFVGRGAAQQSYVPLVRERFVVGRSAFEKTSNDPLLSDLAEAAAVDADGATFEYLKNQVDAAAAEGGWLILLCHEVGDAPGQALRADVLEQLCAYACSGDSPLWIDTVEGIGRYIVDQRKD